MPEIILPGTYITVRDEGLISAGRVATGNIGIVGTAAKGPIDKIQIISNFSEAREIFGDKDDLPSSGKELTLVRALEQVYNNGGRAVYAVRTAVKSGQTAAKSALLMLKDGSAANNLELKALSEGTWGNDIKVKITLPDGAANDSSDRVLEITQGVVKERYTGDKASVLATKINAASRLVAATAQGGGANPPAVLQETALSGGANGAAAASSDYINSLALLEKDIINIVVLAGQSVTDSGMALALQGHINVTAENKRERIAVMGCNGTTSVDSIINSNTLSSERIIYTAPGIRNGGENLPGAYTAAAVAGLISSLPVQTSPTNKVLAIGGLAEEYTSSKLELLVQNRVLAVERREGFRVVKGITTAPIGSAWQQITTRRIVDYAIYGVRSCCNPYIGKLNNERVRGAMKATLDAFLTRMVQDEALTGYELEVSATRAQEIAGECIVTMTIQPTFSIDFVLVTMYLG